MADNYCNNCGKRGHNYNQCKLPITSLGIILYRKDIHANNIEYLMIRRKDTLGFIDFMRGKYSPTNKDYIMNMLTQMTKYEKEQLIHWSFNDIWTGIWGENSISNQYKSEENTSRIKCTQLRNGIHGKFGVYTLNDLIDKSNTISTWDEPEWGFPKGRRNFNENDIDCAIREFTEETGFDKSNIQIISNIVPFDEIFTGSNYKSYKHKYFVTYIDYDKSMKMDNYELSEVSKMEWKTFDGCIGSIRNYNLEKQNMLTKIHNMLTNNITLLAY